MVDTVGVEERRTALDAVNLVAFGEEKLGKIRSVLTGNSCNEGFLQNDNSPCISGLALDSLSDTPIGT
jgi:hypothetical protein